jgi:hypothetical protein
MPFLWRGARRHYLDEPAVREEHRRPLFFAESLPLVFWGPWSVQGPQSIRIIQGSSFTSYRLVVTSIRAECHAAQRTFCPLGQLAWAL